MALAQSPSVVTNGLVFYYDMNNIQKSWKGVPTTNVVGDTMSIYNNVPGDVTATLTTTGQTYYGANIYALTLTPTTASGVSYLTNGNNPGIGVVSSGGGGNANTYTGHAIFYKPTVTMYSTPLFTNYSNIPGYGAGSLGSNSSVAVGNGWYRGQVIWYDTVTRSDGKYWAINPLSATLNIPIVIYWAGPFREDRNSSTFVAPYVYSSRSSSQAVVDLTNNNTWTVNNLTYASNNTFSFNGSNSWIESSTSSVFDSQAVTMESWCNPTATAQYGFLFEKGQVNTQYSNFFNGDGIFYFRTMGLSPQDLTFASSTYITANQWNHIVCVVGSGTKTVYINGIQQYQQTGVTGTIPTGQTNQYVGKYGNAGNNYPFSGSIAVSKVYNRALTEAEVQQNFNALRGRFGV